MPFATVRSASAVMTCICSAVTLEDAVSCVRLLKVKGQRSWTLVM